MPEASFDLVTSTMLLHELDVPAVREAIAESYRVTKPGGLGIHLDFRVRDPFLEFIYYGHARRNNEPYMETVNRMDLEAEFRQAGFSDVEVMPFEEADGAAEPGSPLWRFPWAAFVVRRAPANDAEGKRNA